jgi:hypothetical protein
MQQREGYEQGHPQQRYSFFLGVEKSMKMMLAAVQIKRLK